MITNIKHLMIPGIIILALVSISVVAPAYAACDSTAGCLDAGVSATGSSGGPTTIADTVRIIVNVLMTVLGAISVIMIVIGGIRYVLSQGESAAVASAKNTILYAIIGLIVAIMGYAIVNWVVTAFVKA